MGVRGKANWSFSGADGNHVIAASVETTFTHFTLRINVDGMVVLEKKKMNAWSLLGEYPFRAGQHVGLLKVIRKGYAGYKFELSLDGLPVMQGQHVTLASPQAAASAAAPPTATHSTTSVPMFPEIPSTCPNCGAPVSMNDVNWTGPMNAACARCGSAVPVQWKKIG